LGKHVFVKRKMLQKLFPRIMLYCMLYVRRKFKSATIDLTQYIPILFVLNFIFESLFVSDIVPKNVPTRYPALLNILILSKRGQKRKHIKTNNNTSLHKWFYTTLNIEKFRLSKSVHVLCQDKISLKTSTQKLFS
jgi:hypothetical protein